MNQNSNPEKVNKALYLLMLLPVFMFGVMGGVLGLLDDNSSPLTGFSWGIAIGLVLCVVMIVGMSAWEWIKKEAENGKLLPYFIVGFLVAVALSGFFALNLGNSSCEEYDPDPRGGCISYANDGFETTAEQQWDEFWGKLPVVTIICLLIAYIAYGQAEKNRPKHFKSEQDDFEVSIFPEVISIDLDKEGNSYKYSQTYAPEYVIDVIPIDDFPTNQYKIMETVLSWHKNIVSAATGISRDKVDYNEDEMQHTPYIYGAYSLKKDITYYHLTLAKYEKIYSLSMYIKSLEHEDSAALDRVFFEFIDSFKFTK